MQLILRLDSTNCECVCVRARACAFVHACVLSHEHAYVISVYSTQSMIRLLIGVQSSESCKCGNYPRGRRFCNLQIHFVCVTDTI